MLGVAAKIDRQKSPLTPPLIKGGRGDFRIPNNRTQLIASINHIYTIVDSLIIPHSAFQRSPPRATLRMKISVEGGSVSLLTLNWLVLSWRAG